MHTEMVKNYYSEMCIISLSLLMKFYLMNKASDANLSTWGSLWWTFFLGFHSEKNEWNTLRFLKQISMFNKS